MRRLLFILLLIPTALYGVLIDTPQGRLERKQGSLLAVYDSTVHDVMFYTGPGPNAKKEQQALIEAIRRTEKDSTYKYREEALKAFNEALIKVREKLNK